MADLFGKWVPRDWIDAAQAVVREDPALTTHNRRKVGKICLT